MTASRARAVPSSPRFRLALIALALLSALTMGTAAPVRSQETGASPSDSGAPIALEPPTPLLPFDPKARQPEGVGPAADAPQVQGIEINPLEALDPDSLGLLDAENGGLGEDLWTGSDRERVIDLLALLPDRYRSTVLRDLARRLLLSRAEGPRHTPETPGGQSPARSLGTTLNPSAGLAGAGGGEPDVGLLVLRIDRLGKIGDSKGLARLLEIVPRRFDEEPITRARVESALLLGDVAGGCGEVRKGLPLYYSVPYWQKALIACQLVAGETEQAQLGLGLLKERGLEDDAPFLALTEALTGADAEVPPALAAQPLSFALLQARGQALPAGTEDEADLGVLVAMALSRKTGLEQRVVAAERAAAAGALDPAELGQIYDSFSFETAELDAAAAPDVTTPPHGPRGRALAYQRTLRALGPAAQAGAMAAALDAAWAKAGDHGTGYIPLAVAFQPLASKLPRTGQTLPQAGAVGRALYAAGRFEAAAAWLRFAQQAVATQPEAAGAATTLWPYWRLAGGQSAVLGGGIASWQATQSRADPAALARRAALLRAMLGALDSGLRPSQDRAVPTPQQLADARPRGTLPTDLPAELASTAATGRRGETLLLVLAALGGERLETVEPSTIGAVLTALSDVGFEQEARALAIETALAARI